MQIDEWEFKWIQQKKNLFVNIAATLLMTADACAHIVANLLVVNAA
jgi:hypothetical protein